MATLATKEAAKVVFPACIMEVGKSEGLEMNVGLANSCGLVFRASSL